jgi:hypothetical protein
MGATAAGQVNVLSDDPARVTGEAGHRPSPSVTTSAMRRRQYHNEAI